MRSRVISILVAMVLSSATGCLTWSGGALEPVEVTPPRSKPFIEQTVGDFEFTLEGGKMITFNKAGRNLNEEILKRWKEKGYIEDYEYVKSSRFSGTADYNLTLSGSQYGDSSIVAQIFSGLTLLLIPYTVDQKYDVQYTLENVQTGETFSAAVEDSYYTVVELFLVLAAPVATRGASATMDAMADHLFHQLQAKGAFDGAEEARAP